MENKVSSKDVSHPSKAIYTFECKNNQGCAKNIDSISTSSGNILGISSQKRSLPRLGITLCRFEVRAPNRAINYHRAIH